ncbi:hypothetical protein CU044_3788 [Streptomyces sp. L-9-10]|uniref:DUF6415 family natural product biosynthesis protein n=1 Tax=Streptomyces sp. L-9-10 TaxID=1478131 RepID=UPI00101DBED5|nr:DUF6415 family natural product biosynthesis protein [Streptomyces sp. L-9-10]RYJ26495.1 hypothetical protein CU044_3788 [Streptomyces sp. L-9-10]
MTADEKVRQTPTLSAVQATIDQADAAGRGVGTRTDLAGIADQLQAHIKALLPAGRAHAAQMWRGDTSWYSLTARLDRIQNQIGEGLGEGVLGAHVQVRLLAVDCQWLLERYGSELAR